MAPPITPAAERFWAKVDKTDGCWLWTASKSRGYGTFWATWEAPIGAHRWAYEALVGPIPEGLELDHLCRNRACVNPDHLEPVTHRENVLRSPISLAAKNARKTHCDYGHELSPVRRSPGKRVCLICERKAHRDRQRRYYHERKAAA